ncbi:MAG: SDR family NAD(P)-dependent oxidoreductase [Actinomycetota bacterium]
MPTLRNLIDKVVETTVIPSFTLLGPAIRKRLFEWEDLDAIDMSGKVVLITGGNSGLGFASARRLATMGAAVRIVTRDAHKGRIARAAIASASGNDDVGLYIADMSSLASVGSLAAQVWAREARLDVLVNNAGALLASRHSSVDGHEMTFATMVLGPHLLIKELAPLLEDGGRIVTVSSGGMYTQRLRPHDLQLATEDYSGAVAYAHAKRAQVILTELWAERLKEQGTVVHSMHPGWADTPGIEASLPTFRKVTRPLLRDSNEGADTIVYLAAAGPPGQSTGLFWHDRAPRPTHRMTRTKESASDRATLWKALEEMVHAN